MLSKGIAPTHEVVQCLHHSTTCDLNCVLLLIGDRSGRMLVGTWIKYDVMVKAAHWRFLNVACAHGLKWAYEHVDNYPDKLENLINTSIGSNIEDVITEIKLYHEITNSNKLLMTP